MHARDNNVPFQQKTANIYTLEIYPLYNVTPFPFTHMQDLAHDDIIDDDKKVNFLNKHTLNVFIL